MLGKFPKFIIIPVLWCFVFLALLSHKIYAADVQASIQPVPGSSNFQFVFSSHTNQSHIKQNTVIPLTITYGWDAKAITTPLTLTVNWHESTVNGVSVYDYVLGSATKGYNGAAPTVDLVNQTITWEIPAFPPETKDQTVHFTLRANCNYTGNNVIRAPVSAVLTTPYLNLPSQRINITFTYDQTSPDCPVIPPLVQPLPQETTAASPQPTSFSEIIASPSGTTKPMPTVLPKLLPTPSPFEQYVAESPKGESNNRFSRVEIARITYDTAHIFVETVHPSALVLHYGTSLDSLDQSFEARDQSLTHTIPLPNLTADTTYYFKLDAVSPNGDTTISEFFTFKTAQISQPPQLHPGRLIVTSGAVLLASHTNSPERTNQGLPTIVLPQSTNYEINLSLDAAEAIKYVHVELRDQKVLGVNTYSPESTPNIFTTQLIEQSQNNFTGRLHSNKISSFYKMYAKVADEKGNIIEQYVADLKVIPALQVFDTQQDVPVENASVLLYKKNSETGIFEVISPELFPIKNPSFSNSLGEVKYTLPLGTYKASISAVGYETKEEIFTLGVDDGEEFPKIYIDKKPNTLLSIFPYYWDVTTNVADLSITYVKDLSGSAGFFNLINFIVSLNVIVLFIVIIAESLSVPVLAIPHHLRHYRTMKKREQILGEEIKGKIVNENDGNTIDNAVIFLIDTIHKKVKAHTLSTLSGDFLFAVKPHRNYLLKVIKAGYEPGIRHISDIKAVDSGGYMLGLRPIPHTVSLFTRTQDVTAKLLTLLYESFLLSSLVLELAFMVYLGWQKALIFFMLSLVAVVLWIGYTAYGKSDKKQI